MADHALVGFVERVKSFPWRMLPAYIIWILFFLILVAYLLLNVAAPNPRRPLPSEKMFTSLDKDGKSTEPAPLPCWFDRSVERYHKAKAEGKPFVIEKYIEPAELFMTVIVPAYNEEYRLRGMLEEAVSFLENEYGMQQANGATSDSVRHRATGQVTRGKSHSNGKVEQANPSRGWEILIIDDGSKDATIEVAQDFARTHQLPLRPRRMSGPWTHRAEHAVNIPAGSIRLVSLVHNRGKGGAVTHGMRHVRGEYVVFADADGASKFDDLSQLVSACQSAEDADGRAVAVGSRAHLVDSEAVVKRSKLRNFLMHSFHLLLRLMTPPKTASVKDTQCGFKLFSRPCLPYIIPYMHTEGWIFDVEMLMLAEFADIPVVEVPIGWQEVKGSKLNVIWDSLGMAYGLAVLRICWGLGIYRRTEE